MLEELRKLMRAIPFRPFKLHMTDGRAFPVPHPDYIMVTSKGVIVVEDDEGLVEILPALLLAGIEAQPTPS